MLSDWITAKDVAKIPKKRKNSISLTGKSFANTMFNKKSNKMKLMGAYTNDNKYIKSLKDLNYYLGFNNNNKLIVIYSHCYPDFPNIYGKTWYYDYYS